MAPCCCRPFDDPPVHQLGVTKFVDGTPDSHTIPAVEFTRPIQPVRAIGEIVNLEIAGKFERDKTVIKHYSPFELKALMSKSLNDVSVTTFGKLGFQRIIAVGRL